MRLAVALICETGTRMDLIKKLLRKKIEPMKSKPIVTAISAIILLVTPQFLLITCQINEFAETAEVEFEDGRWAEYSFKQLEELELAYAITIHKSQGSEYPAVVIPILSGPKMLLNRNLLYTAVTRARKCVTVVGSEETLREMIRNEKQQQRYSSLDQRICEMEE